MTTEQARAAIDFIRPFEVNGDYTGFNGEDSWYEDETADQFKTRLLAAMLFIINDTLSPSHFRLEPGEKPPICLDTGRGA